MCADRASVKFSSNGYSRNTSGIAMGIRNSTRVNMTKALVPKNTLLVTSKMVNQVATVIWLKK